jgi:hypothetical protein
LEEIMVSERPPEVEPFSPIRYTSDVFPTELAEVRGPVPGRRTRRARHGRPGSPRRSRSRYHPRPQPRRRADVMGFNAVWWTVLVISLVVVLALWI